MKIRGIAYLFYCIAIATSLSLTTCSGGGGGGGGDNGGNGGDTIQPTVSFINPLDGATDVDVSTLITATFSEDMDDSTITTNTFTLSSNPSVSGMVSYNSNTNTAVFTPNTNLDYMITYTATITTEVTDSAGNNLAFDYTWSFTTVASNQGGTVDLPETGQTTCYDISSNVIACSNTGHDGDIMAGVSWPSPRFADNGDGTQTDELTGLMWLMDANCIQARYPAFDTDGTAGNGAVTWEHALDFVAGINDGTYSECGAGYTDWRLPNVNEIECLINAEESNTAIWLANQGFSNVPLISGPQSNQYWSSSSRANWADDAWTVHMTYGHLIHLSKGLHYYVWPVRAETALPAQLWRTGQSTSDESGDDGDLQMGIAWPSPRFDDNSDGTVSDSLTRLMWTKDADAPGPSGCNPGTSKLWQEALNYVDCLNTNNYLGYNDWRLPNRKEFRSLTDFARTVPALQSGHPFTNVAPGLYWSSTSYAFDPYYAWHYAMADGSLGISLKDGIGGISVWPVRAGQ